jgi:hypothetical protein
MAEIWDRKNRLLDLETAAMSLLSGLDGAALSA